MKMLPLMISVGKPKIYNLKSRFIRDFFLAISFLLVVGCATSSSESKDKYSVVLQGNTQGTTYLVKYISTDSTLLKKSTIDSILANYDKELSTYLSSSLISQFNNNEVFSVDLKKTAYFERVYTRGVDIMKQTDGAFNVTVKPLLDVWKIEANEIYPNPDSSLVDSIQRLVADFGFVIKGDKLYKKKSTAQLDVNAIAQGDAVDVLVITLRELGCTDFMVEIGGELYVSGKNSYGEDWKIGVDKPIEGSSSANREIQLIIELTDRAVATSGSYRKFVERNGVKYSHTIDPRTGYPVTHQLLSVTVLADDCLTADAYATAFMVMGKDSAFKFIEEHTELNLDAYFVYMNDNNRLEELKTPKFAGLIRTDR